MKTVAQSRPSAVHNALRSATSARHARLDSGMPLAGDTPTLDDYCDHLLLLQAWLVPLQSWLASFDDSAASAACTPCPPSTALIAADLAQAGCSRRVPTRPESGWQWGEANRSVAYRWGVQYVIEGSRLGGAVLYKRLAVSLAPHRLRYLHNDGIAPGPGWHRFLGELETHLVDPVAIADACMGACDAFDQLLLLLESNLRELHP